MPRHMSPWPFEIFLFSLQLSDRQNQVTSEQARSLLHNLLDTFVCSISRQSLRFPKFLIPFTTCANPYRTTHCTLFYTRGAVSPNSNIHLNLEFLTTWVITRRKRLWSIFTSAVLVRGKYSLSSQPHSNSNSNSDRIANPWLHVGTATSCPLPQYVIPLAALALVNLSLESSHHSFSLPARVRLSLQSSPVQSNSILLCSAKVPLLDLLNLVSCSACIC